MVFRQKKKLKERKGEREKGSERAVIDREPERVTVAALDRFALETGRC